MSEDIQRSLGRIEGKTDQLIDIARQVREDLVHHTDEDNERFARMGQRVDNVGQKVYWLIGSWTIAASFTAWLFKGHF